MRRRSLLALAAGLSLPALARPRPLPDRPLCLVLPFPPGGAIDAMAHILAGPMAEALGQPVIVENRAGAGGMTGSVGSPADEGFRGHVHLAHLSVVECFETAEVAG